jgi:hypothetical protein
MLKDDATFKGVSIQFENTTLNKSTHISLNLKIQNPK